MTGDSRDLQRYAHFKPHSQKWWDWYWKKRRQHELYPDQIRYHIRRGRLRAARRRIFELQMREAVVRLRVDGYEWEEIKAVLGVGVPTLKRYHRLSIQRSIEQARYEAQTAPYRGEDYVPDVPRFVPTYPHLDDPDRPPKPWRYSVTPAGRAWLEGGPTPRQLPPPGGTDDGEEYSEASSSSSASVPPTPPPPFEPAALGEVLDPPESVQMRKDCLTLRKAMRPFDEIAELLGISEKEARTYTREALQELQDSEMHNADLERKLMIEQIDQMMAGIHAPATGRKVNGRPTMIDLGAIDRMLKLMKQKAELMGLLGPAPEDLRLKLQALAESGGYDIVDLEEIARDVLASHKIRLPEFR